MKYMTDSKKFKVKPTLRETSSIVNRFKKDISEKTYNLCKEFDLDIFKQEVENGNTFVMTTFKNKFSSRDNIYGQDIFLLDFDNSGEVIYTREDILKYEVVQEFGLFIYDTFSSTENVNRFRIGFKTDIVLQEPWQVEAVYTELMLYFEGLVDISTYQTSRLFYGGSNFEIINRSNNFVVDFLDNYLEELNKKNVNNFYKNFKNNDLLRGNINLIKDNNFKQLRKMYKNSLEISEFNTVNDFLEYLKRAVDLSLFVGLDKNKLIYDIFHSEKTPSANIFQDDTTGIYFYKCFSESSKYVADIVNIFEKLAEIKERGATAKVLIYIFNVNISNDINSCEYFDSLDFFNNYIYSQEFNKDYLNLHNILNYNLEAVFIILNLLKDYRIFTKNEDILSFVSVDTITKKSKLSRTVVRNTLNILSILGIIEKKQQKYLKSDDLTIYLKYNKDEGRKDLTIYKLNVIDSSVFLEAERVASILLTNNISITSLTSSIVAEVFGFKSAVYLRTFSSANNNSSKIKNLTVTMLKYINADINKQGCSYEDELIKKLKRYCKHYSKSNYQVVKMRIISDYAYECDRVTKDLKLTLGLTTNKNTNIFYK